MSTLPKAWVEIALSEIANIIRGVTYKKEHSTNMAQDGFLPVIRATNITGSALHLDELVYVPAENISNEQILQPGDVVIASSSGSKDIVGKAGAFSDGNFVGSFGAFCTGIRPSIFLSADYFGYYFQTPSYRKSVSELSAGSNINNLKTRDLASQRFPLPPFAEQNRIVTKLEELLKDLDAGVTELKAAQKKLAQYRQSLLKAAVEGTLTAQWRKDNPATESGAQLLEHILQERRVRWEAKQLAKFAEQGKTPPKEWQKKYPEPVQPDTTDLPPLPEGWVWATLSQVGWLDRGRSKHRPRNAPHLYGGPYPFVQTGDIRHADTFISDVDASYSEAGLAQSRLWPIGTMCITIAANIGKTAILSIEACFPDSVVGFLQASDNVSVRYVEYFMRRIQERLENEAPATAQKNINLETLAKVVIPIPPLYEQSHMVSILDGAFSSSKENERAIVLALKQSFAQRQNILRAAFSGQLVPQDPNDEPASILLEQIKVNQAEIKSKTKARNIKKSDLMNKPIAEHLSEFIKDSPENEFSFETLKRICSGDYETVKNAVFQILAAEKPIVEQIFDMESGSILFRKVVS